MTGRQRPGRQIGADGVEQRQVLGRQGGGGSAAGLENGFFGAFRAGGWAKGGRRAVKSKKSSMFWALASRKVRAGRFHLVSTNLRIEVWSKVWWETYSFLAQGETTQHGTRNPVKL